LSRHNQPHQIVHSTFAMTRAVWNGFAVRIPCASCIFILNPANRVALEYPMTFVG
jgi:hypothetical protein